MRQAVIILARLPGALFIGGTQLLIGAVIGGLSLVVFLFWDAWSSLVGPHAANILVAAFLVLVIGFIVTEQIKLRSPKAQVDNLAGPGQQIAYRHRLPPSATGAYAASVQSGRNSPY
jgi:hypothetical protein